VNKDLDGRRVVVIGGTSGIGSGVVAAALAQGAEVVVAGRRPVEARPTEIRDNVRRLVVDLGDEASVQAFFEDVAELDHLVVTAAPAPGSWGVFLEQGLAEARSYLDGKFFGSWLAARYAAPRLRPGGSITLLTGAAAVRPGPGMAIVAASFAAVEALAKGLAIDLAPLRVNVLRPGLVDSDMWSFLDDAGRDKLRDSAARDLPVGRIGTIEDLGRAAVFLMTSGYVTGSVLEITGGETLVTLNLNS
jgi:NAD(P)-dependent dehydrogenase (short-subunit alcohol dehydrogenase family)